jgi:hypothetical protein
VLPFLYSTEKQAWLEESIAIFEKQHPEIDVQLDGKGSLDAVDLLAAGTLQPVLWSPADRLAVNLLVAKWQATQRGNPLVRDARWPSSLVMTPLVFVTWDSRAKILLGSDHELSWARFKDVVSVKRRWSALGGEASWGAVKFGHTDPRKSNSGLLTLALMAYGYFEPRDEIAVADVTTAPFRSFVFALEANRQPGDDSAASTGPFMQRFVRQGPAYYDIVMAYEAVAISELPRASGRWEPLHVLYPSINLWSDHPLCLFDTGWVSSAQRRAAEQLLAFLMSAPIQRAALKHGFRPGNLDVPVVSDAPDNPFTRYKQLGIRVEVPRVAQPPDAAVLQALVQIYHDSVVTRP